MDQRIATATTTADTQPLDAGSIAAAAGLAARSVRVVAEIGSTNAELMRAPANGVQPPEVLIAVRQSAGRGRRGRRWIGNDSHSLAISIRVERARAAGAGALTGLSPAIGVALAEALAAESDQIGLKWPNDLYRAERKFAGVLVESRAAGECERVVVGVGLNWVLDPKTQQAIDQPATGLFDAQPPRRERERIAGSIAAAAMAAVTGFFADGIGQTVRRWARFDRLFGREVVVTEQGAEILRGIADGLDASGALRVVSGGRVIAVAVGDVSVRAAAGRDSAAGVEAGL